MSMQERYTQLLHELARHVGLDAQSLADTQEIVIDDVAVGLSFTGTDDFADVVFFANLGAPAQHRLNEVCRTLLEANYLWVGTGGATLAVRQDTGEVLLAARTDLAHATAPAMAALLDAFTEAALFWKKYVADEIGEAPSDYSNLQFSLRA